MLSNGQNPPEDVHTWTVINATTKRTLQSGLNKQIQSQPIILEWKIIHEIYWDTKITLTHDELDKAPHPYEFMPRSMHAACMHHE